MPKGKKSGRPPIWPRRQLINGIRCRAGRDAVAGRVRAVRAAGPVYDLFRRWQRDGTWKRIFTSLQPQADAKELITWDVSVDSTVCRAHHHAAGAVKRGISRGSRLGASRPRLTTTASGAHGAG